MCMQCNRQVPQNYVIENVYNLSFCSSSLKLPTPLFAVMQDQLNFVLEILFFNDIIPVGKISIY